MIEIKDSRCRLKKPGANSARSDRMHDQTAQMIFPCHLTKNNYRVMIAGYLSFLLYIQKESSLNPPPSHYGNEKRICRQSSLRFFVHVLCVIYIEILFFTHCNPMSYMSNDDNVLEFSSIVNQLLKSDHEISKLKQ